MIQLCNNRTFFAHVRLKYVVSVALKSRVMAHTQDLSPTLVSQLLVHECSDPLLVQLIQSSIHFINEVQKAASTASNSQHKGEAYESSLPTCRQTHSIIQ